MFINRLANFFNRGGGIKLYATLKAYIVLQRHEAHPGDQKAGSYHQLLPSLNETTTSVNGKHMTKGKKVIAG